MVPSTTPPERARVCSTAATSLVPTRTQAISIDRPATHTTIFMSISSTLRTARNTSTHSIHPSLSLRSTRTPRIRIPKHHPPQIIPIPRIILYINLHPQHRARHRKDQDRPTKRAHEPPPRARRRLRDRVRRARVVVRQQVRLLLDDVCRTVPGVRRERLRGRERDLGVHPQWPAVWVWWMWWCWCWNWCWGGRVRRRVEHRVRRRGRGGLGRGWGPGQRHRAPGCVCGGNYRLSEGYLYLYSVVNRQRNAPFVLCVRACHENAVSVRWNVSRR